MDKPVSVPPPKILKDAKSSEWWEGYSEAIVQEFDSLEKNQTWSVVDLKSIPFGTTILRSKIVFDDKRDSSGKLLKFKARLVAMGFTQKKGVNYYETFASVMTHKSFRTLLAIWNTDESFDMEHRDVKTAFINAPMDEDVYCYLPDGVGVDKVCVKLKKTLYGTKQAAFLRRL